MDTPSCKKAVALIDHFSILDKIIIRFCFFGSIIIGTYSIFMVSNVWGVIYLAIIVSSLGIICRYSFCPFCPYPTQYSDCLFIPAKFVKKIVRHRNGEMTSSDKFISLIGFAIIAAIPQYWLLKDMKLFLLYWILLVPMIVRVSSYLCKRCRFFPVL